MPLVVERPQAADATTAGLLPFAPNSSRGMTVAASEEKSMGSMSPLYQR